MVKMFYILLLFACCVNLSWSYGTLNCYDDRSVIVHLFTWRHEDIAAECERWLGPKGYCGVQVTPPHEHREIRGTGDEYRPWWERYQPVSYIMETRSGDREQFFDMVRRCDAVKVRVYAEVVPNHMTSSDASGIGSAGSAYDAPTLTYPMYGPEDFNCCDQLGSGNCDNGGYVCSTSTCSVTDYNNDDEVRHCQLFNLVDVAMHLDQPRGIIREFLSDLLEGGVAGFHVDSTKHMYPDDLETLYDGLALPDGSTPFIYNEFIDVGGESIGGEEYFHLGLITEIIHCDHMAEAFRKTTNLAGLVDYGTADKWGLYPSENALVFIDNHDNQRGHGSGGDSILTFFEPKLYTLATLFTMAHPYGVTRMVSSYRWPGGKDENTSLGPPTNDGEDIKEVVINEDETCGDGSEHTWVCEHRWPAIANMVSWRNAVGGEGGSVDNWWDNGAHQIAFSRAGAGFIAFNNEDTDMSESLVTGLPDGEYCDIISSKEPGDQCSTTVTVSGGRAQIVIPASAEVPAVAFYTGSESLIKLF